MTPEVGDRVQLGFTSDKFTRLELGALGTVTFIDDLGTAFVDWDDGSKLGLIPGVDRWTVEDAA